jgi:hypothetical protein
VVCHTEPEEISEVELPRCAGLAPLPLADDLPVEGGVEVHQAVHEVGLQPGVQATQDHSVIRFAQPRHVHLQSEEQSVLNSVLRIRDPVPFRPLDPGSRMGKKNQDPYQGSGSGMNIPDHISKSLEKFFLG